MKKLNLLNIIYLVILAGMIIATVIKVRKYDSGDRYYFSAGLTAPLTYPVFVNQAYFILAGDNNETGSVLLNDVNQHNSKWGYNLNNTDLVSDRSRLPKALILEYASYRDKKYYYDSIPLPATLIDSIFKSSVAKGMMMPLSMGTSDVGGLSFLIGLANNGNVVVWLQGKNYEKKLGTYHFNPQPPTGKFSSDGNQVYTGKTLFDVFYISDDLKEQIATDKDSNANYADSTSHYLEITK
jgi:hypothetical protein